MYIHPFFPPSLPTYRLTHPILLLPSPHSYQSIVEMLTGLTSTDSATWPDALHKVRQRQKELKMVDSALVFHIKDVYRERLKGLIRQAADVSVPMEAALMRGETVTDKDAKEAKLRNVIGAAMLLMRLMRQFLEVSR